ncbi:MAG TPA: TIGR01459 family HAD-type hydrolase [Dongiaceae bacterium]|jgi:HAD superfamily hydrolase (TIGR01459 family)|nr:TIGR01459 family HAD-type hydrolase [Dongiaceae bacterium]
MKILAGLSERRGTFEAALVDLWGVMHNGLRAYEDALACLDEMRRAGIAVFLLSNAPRRAQDVAHRIAALGIAEDRYDALYSSGEETWRFLRTAPLGTRAFPIMSEKDRSLIVDTPIELDEVTEADFILASGIENEDARVADYAEKLASARMRALPMLCANPDLIVHVGAREEICAGAIAAAYESEGGQVHYIGKPHPEIYRKIFAERRVAPERVLAIGDSFRTDIAGGRNAGCQTLLVAGGIHRRDLLPLQNATLEDAVAAYPARPDFVIPFLRW